MTYPYISFDEASKKISVSLKTVYNYVTKSNWQVRTNKAYGKSFVNFEDLQSYITKPYTKLQNDYNDVVKIVDKKLYENTSNEEKAIDNKEIEKNVSNDHIPLQNLQNDYKVNNEKIEQLEKFNSNLQDQANKYAIKLNEEKEEKKVLQVKYDNLEGEYRNKLEEYAEYRVKATKVSSFYIAIIAITILCLCALLYLYLRQLYIF